MTSEKKKNLIKKKSIHKSSEQPFGPSDAPPGYDGYVQEHRKRLKQLEREYYGDNLSNPPGGDHD